MQLCDCGSVVSVKQSVVVWMTAWQSTFTNFMLVLANIFVFVIQLVYICSRHSCHSRHVVPAEFIFFQNHTL